MASDKLLTLKLTASERDHQHKSLGYLRCWIQGFEAAGKTGPHAADALRQMQVILARAKA